MKILVTGGSGFIGTQLMKKLVNIDCDVINYDKNNSIEYPEKTIIGDIIDLDEIKSGTNIGMNSATKAYTINDTTFGNTGIQLEFNSGTPTFCCSKNI